MVNKTRIAALLLLPVILLPVAGCAWQQVKEDTAMSPRRHTLYSLAKERVDRGDMKCGRAVRRGRAAASLFGLGAPGAADERLPYYMAQKYPEAVSSAQPS
jgi:hypothetical protein